ncbi:MAG: TolC family protein [Bacteroidales bacterium]
MKHRIFTILIFSGVGFLQGYAQTQWSLKQCIDYAIEHNIDIKQRKIETENKEIELNTAKMSRLPNLSAGLGESFGFGRSTGRDGVMEDRTSSQTSFSLETSVPVFTGFRIPNQVAAKKFDLAASLEDLNKAQEDLSLSITGYYLQTLFYKELLVIARQQVALTREQLAQTTIMVEAGKSPVSEQYETEAQLAKDELSLTESLNNVNLALLDLSQALNLEADADFDIVQPDINSLFLSDERVLLNPLDIYAYSVENRPGIKAAGYLVKSSQRYLKIAQSAYYPTLNLGAGYSTNYFYNYNLAEGSTNTGFGSQLRNNGSESLRLSMSIPIFNRLSTRNQVKQARLSIQSQQLSLEKAKQNLFKEIQQAYFNAVASKDKFASAEKSVKASRIAFYFEETKYKHGRSSALELSNARVRLEKSLAEEAQAKYDFVFRTKILDFYQGKPLY